MDGSGWEEVRELRTLARQLNARRSDLTHALLRTYRLLADGHPDEALTYVEGFLMGLVEPPRR